MRGLIAICGVLAAWLFVTELRLVAPLFLPSPRAVLFAYRPQLLDGAVASTARALTGFFLGVGLGYILHFVCWSTGTIGFMDRNLAASRAIPAVAFMPLFILWFGFGETGRVLVVVLTAMFFFVGPLTSAGQTLPREWSLLRQQLGVNALQYYFLILFPASLTSLIGPLRVTFSVCFTVAIASDYMGAQSGIGKFIDTARTTFNVPAVFLAIIVAAGIGVTVDVGLGAILNRVVHWKGRTAKA